jgi:hypothetical protein
MKIQHDPSKQSRSGLNCFRARSYHYNGYQNPFWGRNKCASSTSIRIHAKPIHPSCTHAKIRPIPACPLMLKLYTKKCRISTRRREKGLFQAFLTGEATFLTSILPSPHGTSRGTCRRSPLRGCLSPRQQKGLSARKASMAGPFASIRRDKRGKINRRESVRSGACAHGRALRPVDDLFAGDLRRGIAAGG